ncbi:MAG: ACP phosphodiesterase [Saprospiraceae bacterium]
MNFLGHCYLSCSDEGVLIGNFITDFLTPRDARNYNGAISRGIQLHRRIDAFTDDHPLSRELALMLRERHGKYASVVVDLVWDYYLSSTWRKHSDITLERFTSETYTTLQRIRHEFPRRLRARFDEMIANDFLNAYKGLSRARQSLKWVDRRARFESNFEAAIEDIEKNDRLFESMFHVFFQDIKNYVKDYYESYPSK